MAIVKCKECGREVSDKATKCPHCGAHMGILFLHVIILVCIAFGAFGFALHLQYAIMWGRADYETFFGGFVLLVIAFIAFKIIVNKLIERRSVSTKVVAAALCLLAIDFGYYTVSRWSDMPWNRNIQNAENATSPIKTESTESEQSTVEDDEQNITENQPKSTSYGVGTYFFTDNCGGKWEITLNDDKSMVFESSYVGKFYGTWNHYVGSNNMICFKFSSMAESPRIEFSIDRSESGDWSCLYEGYWYATPTDAKAHNPRKRFQLE